MYVIIHAEELVSGNDNMKRVLECAVGVNWHIYVRAAVLEILLLHCARNKVDRLRWMEWLEFQELSDQEHYQNAQHNAQYDHEAFLGEEAKTFDQLTPEESRRRLG